MRRIALLVLLAVMLATYGGGCCTNQPPIQIGAALYPADAAFPVIRIIDGDTFTIRYDGEQTSVRIHGIDAPELRASGGDEARAALAALVEGRAVVLTFPEARKRDNFGRLLAVVHVDGVDVGAELLRQGHAVLYRR